MHSASGQISICRETNGTVEIETSTDEFVFRIPTNDKLEKFLEEVLLTMVGVMTEDGPGTRPHEGSTDPQAARAWLRGGPCAAVRKL